MSSLPSAPFVVTNRLWYSGQYDPQSKSFGYSAEANYQMENTGFKRFINLSADLSPLITEVEHVSYGLIVDRAAPLGEVSLRNRGEYNLRVFCVITLEELSKAYNEDSFQACINFHLEEKGNVVKLIRSSTTDEIAHVLFRDTVYNPRGFGDQKMSAIGLCTFLPPKETDSDHISDDWKERFKDGFKVTALRWSESSGKIYTKGQKDFGLVKDTELKGSTELGFLTKEQYEEVLGAFKIKRDSLLKAKKPEKVPAVSDTTKLLGADSSTSKCCRIL